MKRIIVSTAGYWLSPQIDHGPDTWGTYVRLKSANENGELEFRSEMLSSGLTMADSLAGIDLYNDSYPVDWWTPLWEAPQKIASDQRRRYSY